MGLELAALDGRLQLRGLLGEGGMGQVYRAWDGALERAVAVKLVRSHDPREVIEARRRLQAGEDPTPAAAESERILRPVKVALGRREVGEYLGQAVLAAAAWAVAHGGDPSAPLQRAEADFEDVPRAEPRNGVGLEGWRPAPSSGRSGCGGGGSRRRTRRGAASRRPRRRWRWTRATRCAGCCRRGSSSSPATPRPRAAAWSGRWR